MHDDTKREDSYLHALGRGFTTNLLYFSLDSCHNARPLRSCGLRSRLEAAELTFAIKPPLSFKRYLAVLSSIDVGKRDFLALS